MSDLTTGHQGPNHWAYPSPLYNQCTGKYESDGMLWTGSENATLADVQALQSVFGENVDIDWPTCFGGESYRERNIGKEPCFSNVVVLG